MLPRRQGHEQYAASSLADGVFVGRNTILSCKNGDIVLEQEANVGFNVEIFSAARVRVGARTLIAAYTYLVGGDHLYDRTDIPVLHQGRTARGIDVGENSWLGAHVVVTDGAPIGRDAIVGAGSVVIGEASRISTSPPAPRRVSSATAGPRRAGLHMCGIVGIVDRDLTRAASRRATSSAWCGR